jgi:hypothetical protein
MLGFPVMNIQRNRRNRLRNFLSRNRLLVTIELLGLLLLSGLITWAYSLVQAKHPSLPEAKLSEVLAIVAVFFAIAQFLDAKRQSGDLVEIQRALSTRNIGVFPDNLEEIIKLVSNAKHHLYILTDFVAYGQYSAPGLFAKYMDALRRLPNRVDVQILCYDAPTSKKAALEHLPDGAENFEGKINRTVFEDFCDVNNILPIPSNNAALREILDIREQQHSHGFNINYLRDFSPFYLWMQDDQEAVITFKIKGDKESGFCFRTQDGDLIRQFKLIFDDAKKYTNPFYHPELGP